MGVDVGSCCDKGGHHGGGVGAVAGGVGVDVQWPARVDHGGRQARVISQELADFLNIPTPESGGEVKHLGIVVGVGRGPNPGCSGG